ncbi:hypothetical protein U8V72_23020 [Priestia filamentosa]|uniref:hypothetical protein n=1 Tax=Priestia filamentosa TaxID=1402861 RepID=UPI00058960DC
MNTTQILNQMNQFMNKGDIYTAYIRKDYISYRYNNLSGSITIGVGELINGVLTFIFDYVNKEGEKFSRIIDEVFKSLLTFANEELNIPFIIGGTNLLTKEKNKRLLRTNELMRMKNEEKAIFKIEDYDIKWMYKSKDDVLKGILSKLVSYKKDWEKYTRTRKVINQRNSNYFFEPLQKYVFIKDVRITPLVNLTGHLTFSIVWDDGKEKLTTNNFKNPVEELLEEYIELNGFKNAVDKRVFTSLHSFVNAYTNVTENSFSVAGELRKRMSAAHWRDVDADAIFNVLLSSNIISISRSLEKRGLENSELSIVEQGLTIKFQVAVQAKTISILYKDHKYVIESSQYFPCSPDNLNFYKYSAFNVK